MTLKFAQITASAANFTTADSLIGVQNATADRLFTLAQIAAGILTSPVITGHATIESVLLSGVTGTGAMVLDHVPTIGTSTINNSTLGTATINNSTLGTATLNNATLNTATINTSTLNTPTINTAILNAPLLNNSALNTSTLNTTTINNATINTATINNASLNSSGYVGIGIVPITNLHVAGSGFFTGRTIPTSGAGLEISSDGSTLTRLTSYNRTGTTYLEAHYDGGSHLFETGPVQIQNITPSTSTATGALIVAGGLGLAGAMFAGSSIKSVSPTAGIGYATGAGGTGTQSSSKSTTVTLSPSACICGQITMNNASLGGATIVSFTLTNTAIAATDVLVLNHISGGTIGAYTLNAQAAAGSATINVRNNTAGALTDAIVIQFVVIKAVNA
jgi:hypothetical protein